MNHLTLQATDSTSFHNICDLTEKEIVLDMIRAVCTSDREFREGYNEAMKSPMYDDQLLQQESSLDLDEIQKYNNEKRKEREEMERKKREKEDAEKPR